MLHTLCISSTDNRVVARHDTDSIPSWPVRTLKHLSHACSLSLATWHLLMPPLIPSHLVKLSMSFTSGIDVQLLMSLIPVFLLTWQKSELGITGITDFRYYSSYFWRVFCCLATVVVSCMCCKTSFKVSKRNNSFFVFFKFYKYVS